MAKKLRGVPKDPPGPNRVKNSPCGFEGTMAYAIPVLHLPLLLLHTTILCFKTYWYFSLPNLDHQS